MRLAAILLIVACATAAVPAPARHFDATIVRDDWGIAHVHGATDADAVFGMAYAQAEDDFNRVEYNYLTALGRRAQADGASAIYADLRQRLWVDPADLQARYERSPSWLQQLMIAWAAGLNAFLRDHPNVHPKVITHFEPWMALSFTEGSIGGDIEDADLSRLAEFYGGGPQPSPSPAGDGAVPVQDPGGSNGIAIAPQNTVDRHALLLINPHTSFYFRSELQMQSDQGLDAYGAVTWGQFFIYQGFNPHIGWMHTSTGANNVDRFAETIVRRGNRLFYRYGTQLRPVSVTRIAIPYRLPSGAMAIQSCTVYHTHHGPIVDEENGKWIALALMYRPVQALEQSFLRTKATDFAHYRQIAQLQANSSNNTIFADDKGEIAYMHPQFMPRRDDRFDYTQPVDGSNPATDWNGVLPLDALPQILNPAVGWIFNTNDSPWTAAGPDSPKAANFPHYMDTAGENARGVHATLLLERSHDLTIDRLRALAFDSYLPLFSRLIPPLVNAYDALPAGASLKRRLSEPVATLRAWNDHWGSDSVATSLAIFWADRLAHTMHSTKGDVLAAAPAQSKLDALAFAVRRLANDYGSWRTPWGDINRFQRVNDSITPEFSDAAPSIPVPFVAGTWGSLASFAAKPYDTKRWYGTAGNSFVAVVEFGPRVHAIAVTAGGESGHPGARHFDDEATRYAGGNLRTVYFYSDELKGHTESVERAGS
jgi:acyl-homoserine-lactone acylase